MAMKKGGTFGALSERRARNFLAYMTGGDATIEQHPRGGYIVRDAYRSGMEWYGRTPRAACLVAGFFPPAVAYEYD
jgi:hypothetical protein